MTRRLFAAFVAALTLLSGCADAPDPGDPLVFCSLLEQGVGLEATSSEGDYARLVLVATPEIRPTIESLQNRARDFDELLADDPPDLEALFLAKFDREAETERAALDNFAEEVCGLEIDRPPVTRWSSHVRERYPNAAWRDLALPSFEVDSVDRIASLTLVLPAGQENLALVEEACEAAVDFLAADGAYATDRTTPVTVRVLLDTVVVLESTGDPDACQLP